MDKNNDIYIADTGNNRILHLDSEWNLRRIIDGFINQGEKDTFSRPNSLVITADQYMYVADTGNARVVQLDQNGDLVRIYTSPHVDNEGVFDANFNFRPLKIGVNEKGHLFILSEDFFEGIITIDADGIFRGLIGAPKVSVSLTEYIWFRLSTDEQRSRRSLFLPTEYSSLTIDDQGFLYATVTSEEDDSIKRLNPAGTDTLRRAGAHEIIGDLNYTNMWQQSTYWQISICRCYRSTTERLQCLDRTRSRIYTYDNDGNLLYMFGYRAHSGQIARGALLTISVSI